MLCCMRLTRHSPRPHKAVNMVGEGQAQGAGDTEESPLTWALEVTGFLGKLTSKLGPREGMGGRQEREPQEEGRGSRGTG